MRGKRAKQIRKMFLNIYTRNPQTKLTYRKLKKWYMEKPRISGKNPVYDSIREQQQRGVL